MQLTCRSASLRVARSKTLDFAEARRAAGYMRDHWVAHGKLTRIEREGLQHLCARTALSVGIREPAQTGLAQQRKQLFIRQTRDFSELLGHSVF